MFAYSNYRRNNHWNQYAWISQVHAAKLVVVHGLCYCNWLILSQQKVTDIINQERQCSKFVKYSVSFPKRLSFKNYENLYWIQFNLISFELVGLTWLKVYNKISLNLLQSSWFQIKYNAVSAKLIELSLCWRVANVHHITVIITMITNCTRFTKPHYIIVKIDLYKDNGCSTLIFILVCVLITFMVNAIIVHRMVSRTQSKLQ